MQLQYTVFIILYYHVAHVRAMFFGGGGGCGGCACGRRPVAPVCPPPIPCGGGFQRSYSYNPQPYYAPLVSYRAPPVPVYRQQQQILYQTSPAFGYARNGYSLPIVQPPTSAYSVTAPAPSPAPASPTRVQVAPAKETGSSSSPYSSDSDIFGDTNTIVDKVSEKPTQIKNDLDLDDANSLANFESTIEAYKMQNRGGVRRSQEEKCSSSMLKKIIYDSMSTDNVSISKLRISQRAKKAFGYNFDVVCSDYDFSYLISSNIYCRVEKQGKICLAYEK